MAILSEVVQRHMGFTRSGARAIDQVPEDDPTGLGWRASCDQASHQTACCVRIDLPRCDPIECGARLEAGVPRVSRLDVRPRAAPRPLDGSPRVVPSRELTRGTTREGVLPSRGWESAAGQ